MEILFGVHPVAECIRAGRRRVKRIQVSGADRVAALEKALGKSLPLRVEMVPREALGRVAGTANHQGVIATVEPYPYADWESLVDGENRFLLLLDNLTDPQNVGAILRTAFCAGVTGVALRKHHAARITPVVAKASAGASEHLNVCLVPNHSLVLGECGELGYTRIALSMDGEPLWGAQVQWGGNLAIVIGAEGRGLSPLLARQCDRSLSVPMAGSLDSLNASVAAALVLYEVFRRRTGG